MHILSPETDNYSSWINWRERMTVENISWSISTKECCRPQRGLNPRPSGLQSDGDPTEPPRPATLAKNVGTGNGTPWNHFYGRPPYSDSRPRWLSWMRRPTGDQEVAGSTPAEVSNILLWRLIMKYFFTVILSLRLIQEGQLSVSGERMCTILVNRLED